MIKIKLSREFEVDSQKSLSKFANHEQDSLPETVARGPHTRGMLLNRASKTICFSPEQALVIECGNSTKKRAESSASNPQTFHFELK